MGFQPALTHVTTRRAESATVPAIIPSGGGVVAVVVAVAVTVAVAAVLSFPPNKAEEVTLPSLEMRVLELARVRVVLGLVEPVNVELQGPKQTGERVHSAQVGGRRRPARRQTTTSGRAGERERE